MACRQFSSAVLLNLCVWASGATSKLITDESMRLRHEQWMAQHGRVYIDSAEKELRFKIFKTNVECIHSFNSAEEHKYTLSVNQFADMTNEEFKATRTGFRPSNIAPLKATRSFKYVNVTAMPSTMDWRTRVQSLLSSIKANALKKEPNESSF